MLDCGWCNSLPSCVIKESCTDSFTTNSSTCPPPQITMVCIIPKMWQVVNNVILMKQVNPNSGPYQGGTDVTISGTDLGVVVEDIFTIIIGGSRCVNHTYHSYQPGSR